MGAPDVFGGIGFTAAGALFGLFLCTVSDFLLKERLKGKEDAKSLDRLFSAGVCGGLSLAAFLLFSGAMIALLYAAAASLLIACALCDVKKLCIPDCLLGALLLIAACKALLSPSEIWRHLIGAAVGGGFYLLFFIGSLLFLGREGMGLGDVFMMAAAGLLSGFEKILIAIAVSSLTALLFLPGKGEETKIALSPSLAIGTCFALFYGDQIVGLFSLIV